jgi:lipoprotein-releasing system permease protein
MRPLELVIALRYLRSRSKNRFVSFISLMSVSGIALAVAVLIAVLSAMNGFEYQVHHRILDVLAHGTITGIDGRIAEWRRLQAIAERHPGTVASAPFIRGEAMLVSDATVKGVELRGIEPTQELATVALGRMLRAGSFDSLISGSYNMVIGQALAELLGVGVGDQVVLLVPEGIATPAGVVPRMRRFRVTGIFYAGMYEYDRGLVFINMADAARLFRFGDAVSGLRLAFEQPARAAASVRSIAEAAGGGVYVTDWSREHQNFFRSIQLTKSIMFVILLLVVGVAAFNIVSTLVMVVREKRGEIAILRTLGAAPRSVLKVFMLQGTLIGVLGTALGVTLGVAIAANLDKLVSVVESGLGMKFLAPDIYFISDFPTQLQWSDVATIAGIALALAFASTLYPAWRGAVMPPAEALRYH